MQLCHGDIVYAESPEKLTVHENSYIAFEDGVVKGIYPVIPENLIGAPVTDFGRGVIIPAFCDMHVHAAQYVQRGIGMDVLLSDWLSRYTFPQEARFKELEYAIPVYSAFTDELVKQGTLYSNVFATIHRQATNVLMREMERRGLHAYVGKVNMDINSPEYLCETVEESLRETEAFIEENSGNKTAKPILAPRFAPTCSMELMTGLGKLGKKYGIGLHTHLVESKWEAAEAVRMYPECGSDAGIYEKAGLLGNGPSIFAHFIFPTKEDKRIVKKYDCLTTTCPDATVNVIAGIMPAGRLMDEGIRIGIGCDVAAGQDHKVYRQVASAIRLSKLKEFYEPENRTLTLANAFYMATKAGGRAFGKVGSFENGYAFSALVIDGLEDGVMRLTPEQRLERFCYAGDDRNIAARFLDGKAL